MVDSIVDFTIRVLLWNHDNDSSIFESIATKHLP